MSEAWVPLTEAETKWKSERETSLSFRQPRECTIVTETPNAWKVFIKEENDNYRLIWIVPDGHSKQAEE